MSINLALLTKAVDTTLCSSTKTVHTGPTNIKLKGGDYKLDIGTCQRRNRTAA